MKKLLVILSAFMLLFATSASAVELGGQKAKVMQMTTMSKADTQALFGKQAVQVNAVKLDKGEMAKTEGEFWRPSIWWWLRSHRFGHPKRIPEPPLPSRFFQA